MARLPSSEEIRSKWNIERLAASTCICRLELAGSRDKGAFGFSTASGLRDIEMTATIDRSAVAASTRLEGRDTGEWMDGQARQAAEAAGRRLGV